MNGPFSKISEAIFFEIFLSSVAQKYSYMIECIFNLICSIVKYGFHVFKVVEIYVIATSGRPLS